MTMVHSGCASVPAAQAQKPAPNGRDLMKAGVILLNRAEVQSGLDRQRHAELLILQLPETHDGRNTWLLNYGVSDEAQARRDNWNARAVECGRSAICVMHEMTRSAGPAAIAIRAGEASR